MNYKEILLQNIDKLHTTPLGVQRIKRNLKLTNEDAVTFCYDVITSPNSNVVKQGKNFYATLDNYIITVNSYSFTIITASISKYKIKK